MEWLRKQLNDSEHWVEVIAIGIGLGIVFGLVIDAYLTPIVETAHAEATEERGGEVVLIEIETTEEYIIKRIRETFPEDGETAVKVARCESHLIVDIQSHHVLNGVREESFGIFQIHKQSWHHVALRLGYENYQTDLEDNLAIARYIYDNAGKRWSDWSCYSKKMI